MLHAGTLGALEVRKRASGALALAGRFPYGRAAVLSDGGRTGRPRKEIIASRAFSYRVDRPQEDIHLLVGHSFDRPLASRGTGTLKLTDRDDALSFEAMISPEIADTSWARDALAAVGAGLMIGLSPGFRIPPKRAVPDPETVTEEPDDGKASPIDGQPQRGAIIRTVTAALLYELSLVTRPAYAEAQILGPVLGRHATAATVARALLIEVALMELLRETEAIPAAYPVHETEDSTAAAMAIWARLEAWCRVRWTPRQVTWVIEGPGGFEPPLQPVVSATTERWTGEAWEATTLSATALDGFALPSDSLYRITATVGAGEAPRAVHEAYKRLSEYIAEDRGMAGASQESTEVGPLQISFERNPAWLAKAIHYSGAADLLRPYRRLK